MKAPLVTRHGVREIDIPEAKGHQSLPDTWNVIERENEPFRAAFWDYSFPLTVEQGDDGLPVIRHRANAVRRPDTLPEPTRYRKQQAHWMSRGGMHVIVYYYATEDLITEIRGTPSYHRLDPYGGMNTEGLERFIRNDLQLFWSYGFRKK